MANIPLPKASPLLALSKVISIKLSNKKTDLKTLLHLDLIDTIFINNTMWEQENYLTSSTTSLDIDRLMKRAEQCPAFAIFCKQEKYSEFWRGIYCRFGQFSVEKFSFSPHINSYVDSFDLLRANYFYYKSTLVRKQPSQLPQKIEGIIPNSPKLVISTSMDRNERALLDKAIQYHSIHAIQRSNEHYYNKIYYKYPRITQHEAQDYQDKINKGFTKIIKTLSTKLIIELYGSYAYILLAEAYVRYGSWLFTQAHSIESSKCYNSALQCCDWAIKFFKISQHSIHNASFGKGFSHSNSHGLPTPHGVQKYLTKTLENTINLKHSNSYQSLERFFHHHSSDTPSHMPEQRVLSRHYSI